MANKTGSGQLVKGPNLTNDSALGIIWRKIELSLRQGLFKLRQFLRGNGFRVQIAIYDAVFAI